MDLYGDLFIWSGREMIVTCVCNKRRVWIIIEEWCRCQYVSATWYLCAASHITGTDKRYERDILELSPVFLSMDFINLASNLF